MIAKSNVRRLVTPFHFRPHFGSFRPHRRLHFRLHLRPRFRLHLRLHFRLPATVAWDHEPWLNQWPTRASSQRGGECASYNATLAIEISSPKLFFVIWCLEFSSTDVDSKSNLDVVCAKCNARQTLKKYKQFRRAAYGELLSSMHMQKRSLYLSLRRRFEQGSKGPSVFL